MEIASQRNNTHRGSHLLLWRTAWKEVSVCVCVRVCLEASLDIWKGLVFGFFCSIICTMWGNQNIRRKLSDAAPSFVRNCKQWALGTLATSQCISLFPYNNSNVFVSYLLIMTVVLGFNPTGRTDIVENTEVLTDIWLVETSSKSLSIATFFRALGFSANFRGSGMGVRPG